MNYSLMLAIFYYKSVFEKLFNMFILFEKDVLILIFGKLNLPYYNFIYANKTHKKCKN